MFVFITFFKTLLNKDTFKFNEIFNSGWPVQADQSLLSCFSHPVQKVLSWMSSRLSSSGCLIPAVLSHLYSLSYSGFPFCPGCQAMVWLSQSFSSCCHVLAILSFLSCLGCPVAAALSRMPCPRCHVPADFPVVVNMMVQVVVKAVVGAEVIISS